MTVHSQAGAWERVKPHDLLVRIACSPVTIQKGGRVFHVELDRVIAAGWLAAERS
jgi:hypothetical protein